MGNSCGAPRSGRRYRHPPAERQRRQEQAADGVRRRKDSWILERRHRLVVSGHRVDLMVRFLEDRVLLAKVVAGMRTDPGRCLIGEWSAVAKSVTVDGLSCDDWLWLDGDRQPRHRPTCSRRRPTDARRPWPDRQDRRRRRRATRRTTRAPHTADGRREPASGRRGCHVRPSSVSQPRFDRSIKFSVNDGYHRPKAAGHLRRPLGAAAYLEG